MRRRCFAWRLNSSRNAHGRPNCRRFALKISQNSALFARHKEGAAHRRGTIFAGRAIRAEDGPVSDPTDHALATIASILDTPEAPRVVDTPRQVEESQVEASEVEDAAPAIVPADG